MIDVHVKELLAVLMQAMQFNDEDLEPLSGMF